MSDGRLRNVLTLAVMLCVVCGVFCLIAGQMVPSEPAFGSYMFAVAAYFVCLETASVQMHRFVAQTQPQQLTLFYMVDKISRLLLSAIVFVVCFSVFRLPALSAALGFVLCYFVAMLMETTYFVHYEKSSKMQTR